jgi:hypothetical protein
MFQLAQFQVVSLIFDEILTSQNAKNPKILASQNTTVQ